MIKNYIFDFGNVLAEFYPDRLSAPYAKNEEELKLISEVVFDRLYWEKLDRGTITDEEVKKCIKSRVPSEIYESACSAYDSWIDNLTPVKGMEDIISEISASDKGLYLLSNISVTFADSYARAEWIRKLFDRFDGLVFSGPIGIAKPGREIFEHILKKYDLKAEECLFIDDNADNIRGAESVGIKGYLFDGDADKLRSFLGM